MQRGLKRCAVGALTLVAILGTAIGALAWEREPLSVFHERRARLLRDTGGDGVIVLYGYGEAEVAASVTPFRQNEEFYYLTGWNEPEAIMLLAPKAHAPGTAPELGEEILYLPSRNPAAEKWTGPVLGPDDADASARTGFPTVHAASQFDADLKAALQGSTKIYTELTPQPESGEDCFQAEMVKKIRGKAPQAVLGDLEPGRGTHARGEKSGRNRADSQGRGRLRRGAPCRYESGQAGRVGISDSRADEI